MERELEKTLMEIEHLIDEHERRGNTHTQSVLQIAHEIIEPCAKAAKTLSELEELLSREKDPEITRSSRDNKCGECSQKKWYMKQYDDALKEDGVSKEFLEDCRRTAQKYRKDNDGWIPVEKYGLPKEEGVYDVTIIDGRGVYDSVRWQFLEGTHLSGHQHCVDGIHYWADNYRGDPINKFLSNRVIAWKKKPDPYRPERSRENEK